MIENLRITTLAENSVQTGGLGQGGLSFLLEFNDACNEFDGKYALQVMFVNENRPYAREIRKIAQEIQPDEVQINTPSRANKPKLTPTQLEDVARAFKGMDYVSYYEAKRRPAKPFHKLETLRRRPT